MESNKSEKLDELSHLLSGVVSGEEKDNPPFKIGDRVRVAPIYYNTAGWSPASAILIRNEGVVTSIFLSDYSGWNVYVDFSKDHSGTISTMLNIDHRALVRIE